MTSYYDVLGVVPDAEPEVIAAAYRALMKKYHPDRDRTKAAQERARAINYAFSVLSDSARRRAYDQVLRGDRAQTESPAKTRHAERPANTYLRGPLGDREPYAVWAVILTVVLGAGLLFGLNGGFSHPSQYAPTEASAVPSPPPPASESPSLVAAHITKADVRAAGDAVFAWTTRTEKVNDQELTLAPQRLVRVDQNAYALISTGSEDPNLACHACAGELRVDYVVKNGLGFHAATPTVTVRIPGQGWGQPPSYKVIRDGTVPAIRVTSVDADLGCVDDSAEVYDLAPDGVRENRTKDKASEDCSGQK